MTTKSIVATLLYKKEWCALTIIYVLKSKGWLLRFMPFLLHSITNVRETFMQGVSPLLLCFSCHAIVEMLIKF